MSGQVLKVLGVGGVEELYATPIVLVGMRLCRSTSGGWSRRVPATSHSRFMTTAAGNSANHCRQSRMAQFELFGSPFFLTVQPFTDLIALTSFFIGIEIETNVELNSLSGSFT